MRAAVCEAFGRPLALKEVPEPSFGPDIALIRVKVRGVCHSDLHLVDGDRAAWGTPLPIIPGHEVTGVVEKTGGSVGGLSPGDPVGVPWTQDACGRCAPCRSGAEMLCAALLTGQKRIMRSLIGTRDDVDAMLRFAADHGIDPIVESHPLDKVNEALDRLRQGKVRQGAVLVP